MTHGQRVYAEGMAQANREAKAAVLCLALTVVVWAVCGFGLAGVDVTILHAPLWVFTGCLCTWAFAIVAAVVLARRVITDVDLDAVTETEADRD